MITVLPEPCVAGTIHDRRAANPCSPSAGKWVLAATIVGSSMAFIDGTVVNVALPALQQQLHASVVDIQWVIEAYSLLLAALLLVGGSLGDHYGRRRVFVGGVVLFAAASMWCGFAPGIRQLVIARAVQGVGAALLVPGSLAIISSSFREEDRGRAIGTWSGFSAITAAIGPVIGGWLIEHISWRAVFFINIPLAVIVIAVSIAHVPESSSAAKERLDWGGAALIAAGLGSLVYALIESSRLGFTYPSVVAALIAAIVVVTVFMFWELRVRTPMLPLALFRSRTFTGANFLTLFLYSALGGTLFFVPLNLIQVQHYRATAAGAALLPFILIMFLLSRWSGGLVHRHGAKLPLVIGPMIAAAGFMLFTAAGIGRSYWSSFFPAIVVLGIGMAISVAPLTTTVMNSVAVSRAGIASGINNAVSRTAGVLAIAVLGIVMSQRFDAALEARLADLHLAPEIQRTMIAQRTKLAGAEIPREVAAKTREQLRDAVDRSFVTGFQRVMLIGAGLALLSAITALLMIQGAEGALRPDQRAQKDAD
jgi:EmrB/QacA subfamily drug resistance transporter